MTGGSETDLSGRWRGIFNYPDGTAPTEFEAELRDGAGLITGVTTERHFIDGSKILHATLDGSREGRLVRFRKIYDDFDDDYETVHYDGRVDAAGEEISGEWTVPGAWSGTFLMIRAGGAREAAERQAEEKV